MATVPRYRSTAMSPQLTGLGLGIIIGTLPIIAGLMYPTYAISIEPVSYELTRQFGILFLSIELAFIIAAICNGLNLGRVFQQLSVTSRLALLLFLASFWIGSVFLSQNPGFSLPLIAGWAIHLMFAASVWHLLKEQPLFDVTRFVDAVAAGLMLFAALTAFHMSFLPPADQLADGKVDWGFAIPGFISVRLFGAYCGAIFVLLLGHIWMNEPGGRRAIWLYALLALTASLAIWSGTRAAVAGAVGTVIVTAFVFRRAPSRRFLVLVPLCLFAAALIAPHFAPDGDPRFYLFNVGDGSSTNAASGGRLNYWIRILEQIAKSPLWGAGEGSVAWLVPLGDIPHVQPHNSLLQFALSWGLPATFAALFLMARASFAIHRIARRNSHLIPVVMMVDCLLIMSMFDGMLYFHRFVMLILTGYAICLAAGRAPNTIASGAANQ